MFIMGGCGLAYEYTFSKIASDLLGNSARQWAIIIGVMLFFMGIGADLQKYLKEKNLLDKLIASEIALGILGAFGPLAMLYTFGSYSSHYILVQYAFISSIGLLIGFEIPLITRINETYSNNLSVNLAQILKMDYIGALCGALFWIFVLPRYFNMIETAIVLGIITLIVAGIGLICFNELIQYKQTLALTILASLAGLGFSLHKANTWTLHAEQFLFRDKIIFSKTTPYQHIVLTKSRSNEIACWINGNLQFNSSDEYIYHENLVHPAMHIAPSRNKVLILGGGDGLALREVLKYPDVNEVTLVDIDPTMTELAAQNPILSKLNQNALANAKLTSIKNNALIPAGTEQLNIPNQKQDPRWQKNTPPVLPQKTKLSQWWHGDNAKPSTTIAEIKIINLDATKFIEQIAGRFHIIIIDFPDPNAPDLAKLYSQQFYSQLKTKLAVDGILVQQSSSPVHAKEAYLCIGRTITASGLTVIPYRDNVPSFGEWGWWIGGRTEDYTSNKIYDSINNIETMNVTTNYLSTNLIKSSFFFGKNQLTTENTDTSTLSNPQVYQYYLHAWSR